MKENNWYKELRQTSEHHGFWTRGTKTNVFVAFVVVGLLLAVGVLQATRTITDSGDTWTGTMMISGNTDFKSGSYYNLSKKIYTSNGLVYNATGANLRTAYYNLNSTGGAVYVPPGTFYITPDIRCVNKTQIIGSGPATIIKAGTSVNADGVFYSLQRNNVTLSGFTLDVNLTGTGINWFGCKDITVENIQILNAAGTGIYFQERGYNDRNCSNIMVDKVNIYNTQSWTNQPVGVSHTYNAVFSNIIVNKCTGWGFDIARYCHNITVMNLQVRDCAGGIKCTGISAAKPNKHISFTNVGVSNVANESGFRTGFVTYLNLNNFNIQSVLDDNGMLIGPTGQPVKYVEISNVNINMTGGVYGNGFTIGASSSYVQVTNMFVRSSTGRDLNVDTANNFTLTNFKSYSSGSYNNILNSKDFELIGCSFQNSVSYGLDIDGCSFFSVSDSKFSANAGDGGLFTNNICKNYSIFNSKFISNAQKGLWIYTADSNITIMGCLFKNNGGDGIECNAADSVIIMGCTMWGDPFDDNIVGSHNLTGTAYNIGMTII